MSGNTNKYIGTHNGKFHADEVLGSYLLKQLPEFKTAVIKRSRDPDILKECDIVIDVGGIYDHEKRRYDHHQKDFCHSLFSITGVEETMRLSSAGLVWAHYGKDVIRNMVKQELSDKEMDDIYCFMYSKIIKETDARDNGIEAADPPFRYRVHTDLSSRIARLNPKGKVSQELEDSQFMKAVKRAGDEFSEILEEALNSWLPSRVIVNKAVENRFTVDPSGRIIKLDMPGVSWPAHLRAIEFKKDISPGILYVLFPDSSCGWRVQGVAKDGGFELRKQVLPNCLALRDDELVAACGVSDAIFVHGTGFIGGAKSYEGVLKMAQISLARPTYDDSFEDE